MILICCFSTSST